MDRAHDTLQCFLDLPRDGQLELLVNEGELMPPVHSQEVSYYRLRGYYARVTMALAPWHVERVEGFDGGPAYDRMLEELAA